MPGTANSAPSWAAPSSKWHTEAEGDAHHSEDFARSKRACTPSHSPLIADARTIDALRIIESADRHEPMRGGAGFAPIESTGRSNEGSSRHDPRLLPPSPCW